jgi:predicted ABC-type exoprotein transport system permease subunit
VLTNEIPAAADEQLTQILDDDQLGSADELLGITKGQSRLQPATRRAGLLKFFIQIIVLEIINIVVVPLLTLSTVPFPLALRTATGLLPIFKSWMGYKPPFAYPAWTFASGTPAHRFLSC